MIWPEFIFKFFNFRKQNKLETNHSSFTSLSRRGNQASLNSGDNRFIFKKRLFRNSRELSQDPVEVHMLYAQAVHSVVKCDDYPVSEKVALQLAGLQAQVALGEPSANNNNLNSYANIDAYLPYRISKSRGDDVWVSLLKKKYSFKSNYTIFNIICFSFFVIDEHFAASS